MQNPCIRCEIHPLCRLLVLTPVLMTALLSLITCKERGPSSHVQSDSGACPQTKVLAFPGAAGFGAETIGGRGGQVLFVTNLDDSGQGSLRAAVETAGPRIIIFKVSGTIQLKNKLEIKHPYITIAGETAPGHGITLRDYGLVISADEVIVRYLRSRPGDNRGKEVDAISVVSGENIIIDHCSTSWSVDETLSVSPSRQAEKLNKVTVQWNFITESLNESVHPKGAHGYASLVRGSSGAGYSFHHNLFAHHRSRMPRPGNYLKASEDPIGLVLDFRNNVVYNWHGASPGYNADDDQISRYNFINNCYIPGNNSTDSYIFHEASSGSQAYFRGNGMARRRGFFSRITDWVTDRDPRSECVIVSDQKQLVSGRPPPNYWQTSSVVVHATDQQSFVEPFTHTPRGAYAVVLAEGGAGASLHRDAIDLGIIESVRSRSGEIIDDENDRWPLLESKPAPADSDEDGMPDVWERNHGLNPQVDDGASDRDCDGYTNVEEWIHSLTK